jgi:hypothetical protein
MWYYTGYIPIKRMAKKVNCSPRHVRRLCQKYSDGLLAYKGKNGRWGIRPTSQFIIKAILNPERYVMLFENLRYSSIQLAELKDGRPIPVLKLNCKRIVFLYQHKIKFWWYKNGMLLSDKFELNRELLELNHK